jgi:hypothetical protein
MSCWVAPSIAVELWGVPLEEVMRRAQAGEIASKTEHGFFLVNLGPDHGQEPQPTADTFVTISHEELTALECQPESNQPAEETDPGLDGSESKDLADWREVRRQMGRVRIPPPSAPGDQPLRIAV